jgi:hypothetical protein
LLESEILGLGLGKGGSVGPRRVSLHVILAVAFTAGCQGGGGSSATAPTGSSAGETTAGEVTGTEAGVTTAPPEAFVVNGRGPTRRTINLPHDFRPLILSISYPEGVISVSLRGEGLQRMAGESGPFIFDTPKTGEAAQPGIAQGPYSLRVRGTKGTWTLRFGQPDPANSVDLLGRVISGYGDAVRTVRLDRRTSLEWEMQHDGLVLFADLLGYNDAEGVEQGLGVLQGQFIMAPSEKGLVSDEPLPAGDYLISANADGNWAFLFKASR